MIDRYITLNRAVRATARLSRELLEAERYDEGSYAVGVLISLISRCLSDLERLWPKDLSAEDIKRINTLLGQGKQSAYYDILETHIPNLENTIDDYFLVQPSSDLAYAVLDLLHPRVTTAAYAHFRGGRFRDAVLNSIVVVFDMLRERTGLDADGAELVTETFSLQRPRLVFTSLDTESGRNEQKGFIQILQGYYLGIRNPKAHSLTIETDQVSSAQYLVLSSILCRKIEEATKIDTDQ
ncbi:TIGR02391 family protein [Candidatus Nitrospira neomarina]|uniref:TIGR02391 family protein n=1 Tax=Candidatus Nitrospira neomarina TaxID=3020899 RepID=A0AA96K1B3_9BACT|nr:TIGR02391 family protein [Candidatus Nitrospira neomarina]WNM60509.1 TIGR02391 family protein [Candidatus Nitrospira neomarina]